MNTEPWAPLFPPHEPFATRMLDVGDGHSLFVEESGNPQGLPALVLHGGPGSGCNEKHRQRFDPAVWRIVCFDQRGCGRSTFNKRKGRMHANTTQHLVADNERIRQALGVEAWACIYGTSWGSTLALAYAQAHPAAVRSLVLGGIFLADKQALNWFTDPMGLRQFLPHAFAAVQAHAPHAHGQRLIEAIHAKGGQAVKDLVFYEAMASDLIPNPEGIRTHLAEHGKGAAIEVHYFANRCFFKEGQLLKNAHKIAHLPIHLLQGMQDMVCPPAGAQRLTDALREAGGNPVLELIPACGHRATEAMEAARVAALAGMAARLGV